MKTRTLVSILILVLAVLIIAGSCATGKKTYEAKEDEELFGTWVNTEYDDRGQAGKVVFYPDGTLDIYWSSTSTKKFDGTFSIIEKWTDDEGNWYPQHYLTTIDNIN